MTKMQLLKLKPKAAVFVVANWTLLPTSENLGIPQPIYLRISTQCFPFAVAKKAVANERPHHRCVFSADGFICCLY